MLLTEYQGCAAGVVRFCFSVDPIEPIRSDSVIIPDNKPFRVAQLYGHLRYRPDYILKKTANFPNPYLGMVLANSSLTTAAGFAVARATGALGAWELRGQI